MRSLLIIKRLQVQNANAISGLTWGFPAVSNFLGFTHALSRFLQEKHDVALGGCGVICHQHQVQAYQPAGVGEYVFALSRNPLTKDGKTAPFNEEGRMHMQVSLVIECDFDSDDFDFDTDDDDQDIALFEQQIEQRLYRQRLAGGTIQHIQQVKFIPLQESLEKREKQCRKLMFQLLPGFALVDRSPLLAQHYQQLKQDNPEAEMLDAWMDFAALKFQAQPKVKEGEEITEDTPADWIYQPKPAEGWLVPITTGYKGISQLYEPGEVANTRDPDTPFRFVESVYGVGQWLSPHRIKDPEQLIWRYQQQDDWYLCQNAYQPEVTDNETPAAENQ
ncbi:type I-F CRISPR-associated protein Csy2 [Oceanospirillum beijerinckii]|uniref:type I-F CRISPR-associated protein Csy2 n=1 Tax=Oceanospirillum beijerinckii TaxID=64976 RepID=UPI000408FAE8|nr:type I-F CRISPR-associated protein Csy2 [Oceanospirillum beijerinckii]